MRALLRAPGYSVTVILVVALGIGLNTAVFAIFDGMVFRSLPVPHPGRLVHISGGGDGRPGISYGIVERLKQRTDLLEGIATWSETPRPVEVGGETRVALLSRVDPDVYRVMGVRALIGRTLTVSDTGPVAVISAQFWRDRFGRAPDILGRPVRTANRTFTVVGVMPFEVSGMNTNVPWDVAVPIDAVLTPNNPPKSALLMDCVARLRPGVTAATTRAQLQAIWPTLIEEMRPEGRAPDQWREDVGRTVQVTPAGKGRFFYRTVYEGPLKVLLAMAALLMLIVCSNIATILLARGIRRQSDFAVRMALGATRGRLMRAACSEALILCGAACVVSLAFAQWLISLGVSFLPSGNIPFDYQIGLDTRAVVGSIGLSAVTAVLCGVLPALRTTRIDLTDAVRRGSGTTLSGARIRKALMTGQVAIATVLLAGALLFGAALAGVSNVPLGFRAEGVFALMVQGKDGAGAADPEYFEELARRLNALPGVQRVGMTNQLPMQYAMYGVIADVSRAGGGRAAAEAHCAFPGYFDALGAGFLSGRDLRPGERRAVVVNDSLATRLFGSRGAVGGRLRTVRGGKPTEMEIVGVVAGMRYGSPREEIAPQYYEHCLAAWDRSEAGRVGMAIAIQGGDAGLDQAARRELESLGRQYVIKAAPLTRWVRQRMLRERMLAAVSSIFGIMTVGVVGVGLFGLIAFTVALRARELSIRMALGAQPKQVGWLVGRETLAVTGTGLMLGAGVAAGAARIADAYVFGLGVVDARMLLGSATLLIAVATIAASVPTRRAMRLDPAQALRAE